MSDWTMQEGQWKADRIEFKTGSTKPKALTYSYRLTSPHHRPVMSTSKIDATRPTAIVIGLLDLSHLERPIPTHLPASPTPPFWRPRLHIGCGVGGIATAARLTKSGFDVTIYEKVRTITPSADLTELNSHCPNALRFTQNAYSGGRCSLIEKDGYVRLSHIRLLISMVTHPCSLLSLVGAEI